MSKAKRRFEGRWAGGRHCALFALPVAAAWLALAAPLAAADAAGIQAEGAQGDGVEGDESAVRYRLSRGRGRPGERVSLFFSVGASAPLKSFSAVMRFDARVLRAENVIRVASKPAEAPAFDSVTRVRIDNQGDALPDGTPEDSGFIFIELDAGNAAFAFDGDDADPVFEIQFTIRPLPAEAPPAVTFFSPVRFEDLGPLPAPADGGVEEVLVNAAEVRLDGAVDARAVPAEDLEDGGVIVLGLGEVGFFRRGDANQDCAVDIGDSLFTFSFLFRGTSQPPCEDSVDTNDDGLLDLSDGIYTLHWLFTSGASPAEPLIYGLDPTLDDLGCETAYEDPCYEGT